VKVRFLADADLNKAIVSGVLRREPSIDFVTAHAAGLRRMNDSAVLAMAAEQRRALVSHDVGTMPAHFRAFVSAGKRSAGVFLAPALKFAPRLTQKDLTSSRRAARRSR
jgi:hypothetical protein